MSIFNKSKQPSEPEVVACCLCGKWVPNDDVHRRELKGGEFVCKECLDEEGMPSLSNNSFTAARLHEYVSERASLVGDFQPTIELADGLLKVDEAHESFSASGDIFRYDQMLGFHFTNDLWPFVWDWGHDVVTNHTCSQMNVRISLRNAHADKCTLTFVDSPTYSTFTSVGSHDPGLSADYLKALNAAQDCLTALEQIQDTVRAHEREELMAAIAGAAAPSAADEIRKFHQLAEDGIISQEEFETKKQQLLAG